MGYQIEPFFINLVKTAQNPSSTYRNKQALKKSGIKRLTHRLGNWQAQKQAGKLGNKQGPWKKVLFLSLSLFFFLFCTAKKETHGQIAKYSRHKKRKEY